MIFMQTKILVVEDEAITAFDIKVTLEEMGFETVLTAARGEDAIQIAKELKPDLILMDIYLKDELDGIDVATEIQHIDIPVIFLTAFTNEGIYKRAKLTNPYGFISKPIKKGELKAAIEIGLYKHETDKKIRENEEKYRLQLEKEVNDRTSELKAALKELKRSNMELEQFAYISSHDLQEPLRTIASFTQLLQRRYKGKLDTDADEFIDYVVDATIRMKEQINGLLEYSRVETKGEQFELVDTNNLLIQTIKSLYTLIDESNAKIIYDDLPSVKGDSGQLQRVFGNLISNAIKFRKHEEPLKIHISALNSEQNNEHIFSIEDNGIGIEKQYQNRIFTLFQRLHPMDVYKGTGIGLSVVKRIVERHRGRIWVESEFGKGSIFYFTIPTNE